MRKIVFVILLFSISYIAFSQQEEQQKKQIELIHANVLKTLPQYGNDVQFLKGQVILAHDSSVVYCDSAVYNVKHNDFKAFEHVRMVSVRGVDTVVLRCDSLWFLGDSNLAVAMGKIVLEKDTITLLTDTLTYNTKTRIASYYKGGIIYTKSDTLKSEQAVYYVKDKKINFLKNVELHSRGYKIFTDTLVHDIKNKVSYFYGPTHIYGDTTYLFAKRGYYDHKHKKAVAQLSTKIVYKNQTIWADEINFDRITGIGEAKGNVRVEDTANKTIVLGEYGKFYQKQKKVFVSGDATLIQYDNKDTIWIRSDTLLSFIDTLYDEQDTFIFRKVIGYKHVKVYNKDLQAKCDSIVYSFLDSTVYLYGSPVLWSDSIQLFGKTAVLSTVKSEPYQLILNDGGYIIEHVRDDDYNQIYGKQIVINFKNRKIHRVDVYSDAKAIYYLYEDSTLLAINQIACDTFFIYIKDNKVRGISALGKPSGKLIPPSQATQSDRFLEGFQWFEAYRPLKPEDIYIWKRE